MSHFTVRCKWRRVIFLFVVTLHDSISIMADCFIICRRFVTRKKFQFGKEDIFHSTVLNNNLHVDGNDIDVEY
jgi:hypothetical protein